MGWGIIILYKHLCIIEFRPFKLSSLVVQGFKQTKQSPPRKISIKARLDEMDDFVDFLVIDVNTALKHYWDVHRCTKMLWHYPPSTNVSNTLSKEAKEP